jgi:hypothetical protein
MAVRSQPVFVVAFLIRVEDGIPVGLLAALLALSVVQILNHKFLQAGIWWGDILVLLDISILHL